MDEEITAPQKETEEISNLTRKNLLSTGSTLLNLACSDNPFGGFLKGKYYFIVGDSASGKTFLSMTCLAESQISRHFKDYRLIYDNVEDGMLMDVEKFFGEAVADKLEPPKQDEDGKPIFSYTIEEFYYNLDSAIKEEKPFIYILDSMDGLSSVADDGKFEEAKAAHEKGNQPVAGSYGMSKAKKNSEYMRKAMKGLRDTNSILIVLCQTRDNADGYGKTRAGGHALKFYATVEIWSSIYEKIKKIINNFDRQIGIHVELEIKKNRITGKTPWVTIPIYPSFGIDDLGSCVDYLIQERYWEVRKQTIVATHLKLEMTREKLIQHIEQNNLEAELRQIVGKCWKEIQDKMALKRKSRY